MWKIKNTTGGPVVIPGKNALLKKRQILELTDDELSALKAEYPELVKRLDVFSAGGRKENQETHEFKPRKALKKAKAEMADTNEILC